MALDRLVNQEDISDESVKQKREEGKQAIDNEQMQDFDWHQKNQSGREFGQYKQIIVPSFPTSFGYDYVPYVLESRYRRTEMILEVLKIIWAKMDEYGVKTRDDIKENKKLDKNKRVELLKAVDELVLPLKSWKKDEIDGKVKIDKQDKEIKDDWSEVHKAWHRHIKRDKKELEIEQTKNFKETVIPLIINSNFEAEVIKIKIEDMKVEYKKEEYNEYKDNHKWKEW